MAKAKPKVVVKDRVNLMDLSEEKKIQILTEDFRQFQLMTSAKLGMQIGVRLLADQTKIEAIMVPVRVTSDKTKEDEKQEGEAGE
jgi:hypothetical protein